jgi:hypothetical protein
MSIDLNEIRERLLLKRAERDRMAPRVHELLGSLEPLHRLRALAAQQKRRVFELGRVVASRRQQLQQQRIRVARLKLNCNERIRCVEQNEQENEQHEQDGCCSLSFAIVGDFQYSERSVVARAHLSRTIKSESNSERESERERERCSDDVGHRLDYFRAELRMLEMMLEHKVEQLSGERRRVVRDLLELLPVHPYDDCAHVVVNIALPNGGIGALADVADDPLAAALGHVVWWLLALSRWLDHPLPFRMRYYGSHSTIWKPGHSRTRCCLWRTDNPTFAAALYMLNRNLVELCRSQSMRVAPRRFGDTLVNLHTLLARWPRFGISSLPIDDDNGGSSSGVDVAAVDGGGEAKHVPPPPPARSMRPLSPEPSPYRDISPPPSPLRLGTSVVVAKPKLATSSLDSDWTFVGAASSSQQLQPVPSSPSSAAGNANVDDDVGDDDDDALSRWERSHGLR